ncbi:amino acid ABC transporter substrate-binding protein [Saccharospirillum mangrovi]|uniref:amino acid ABC transporter substrate-binding protein n=1 Tax=Saccharospirillum mangrovi TaxID=2161747 RepID=UPI000D35BB44|nr:amino acid ABC transporter substrate-binding protein [Saccharospirillum mangrovi]
MRLQWMSKTLGIAALAGSLALSAQAEDPIRIGAVAPKTGPLAGGAAVTYWPNVQLWSTQVNDAGGLLLPDGSRRPVEIIEYDDRTDPSETIRAVQRLANNDKADLIIPPYGTGMALAAAPIFDRLGYPMLNVTAITDQTDALTDRYDGVFFTLGATTPIAQGIAKLAADMKADGKLGNRLALVNVADAFGIELAKAAKTVFEDEGFNIVYETSYPPTIQDVSPIINSAMDAEPDLFVAFSYPPDTFALTEQAQVAGLDDQVDLFYTAVANAFPAYRNRFGDSINGVYGVGGVNPENPAFVAYRQAHMDVTGQEPDYWASAVMYSSLQVMQQAIAAVGLDHDAIIDYVKNNEFDTVMGHWDFVDQQIDNYWTVGQWQGGQFYGLGSTQGMDGEAEPID